MIEGTTNSGFEYSVSDDVGNDLRLYRMLCKLEKAKDLPAESQGVNMVGLMFDIAERILGESQFESYLDFIESKSDKQTTDGKGLATLSTLDDDVNSIFKNVNAVKNL